MNSTIETRCTTRTIVIGVALALLASTAIAQEPRRYARCTAGERDRPTLNKTVFPAATFEMVEDEQGTEPGPNGPVPVYYRHGVERLKLAEGVELEVNLGGCGHHGNAYRFRIAKTDRPTTDAKFWIDKAVELVSLIEKGNTDGMVDLPALKRALQTRATDPRGAPFRQDSIDGIIPRGGGEDRGRISEAYLVAVNQRRADSTLVSVSYLIGPL